MLDNTRFHRKWEQPIVITSYSIHYTKLYEAETPGTDFTWSGNNTKDVAITWNPTSLNGTYYLVVEYSQELTAPAGAAGSLSCDINNIKVYPITPKNGFWLDIDASTSTAIADMEPRP